MAQSPFAKMDRMLGCHLMRSPVLFFGKISLPAWKRNLVLANSKFLPSHRRSENLAVGSVQPYRFRPLLVDIPKWGKPEFPIPYPMTAAEIHVHGPEASAALACFSWEAPTPPHLTDDIGCHEDLSSRPTHGTRTEHLLPRPNATRRTVS